MEGVLEKKKVSSVLKTWQKRYFSLDAFTLTYYDKKKTEEPRGKIDLRSVSTVVLPADQARVITLRTRDREYVFRAPTEEERQAWYALLKVFEGDRADQDIPMSPVLANALTTSGRYILMSGTQAHGIFRVSGTATKVDELRVALLCGTREIRPGTDIHTVASCFKQLLRRMPDTLFTHDLYYRFLADDPTPTHKELAALVSRLPEANRKIMLLLTEILAEVSRHDKDTGMNIKNLATCIGPSLSRRDIIEMVNYESLFSTLVFDKNLIFRAGQNAQHAEQGLKERVAAPDASKGWGHGQELEKAAEAPGANAQREANSSTPIQELTAPDVSPAPSPTASAPNRDGERAAAGPDGGAAERRRSSTFGVAPPTQHLTTTPPQSTTASASTSASSLATPSPSTVPRIGRSQANEAVVVVVTNASASQRLDLDTDGDDEDDEDHRDSGENDNGTREPAAKKQARIIITSTSSGPSAGSSTNSMSGQSVSAAAPEAAVGRAPDHPSGTVQPAQDPQHVEQVPTEAARATASAAGATATTATTATTETTTTTGTGTGTVATKSAATPAPALVPVAHFNPKEFGLDTRNTQNDESELVLSDLSDEEQDLPRPSKLPTAAGPATASAPAAPVPTPSTPGSSAGAGEPAGQRQQRQQRQQGQRTAAEPAEPADDDSWGDESLDLGFSSDDEARGPVVPAEHVARRAAAGLAGEGGSPTSPRSLIPQTPASGDDLTLGDDDNEWNGNAGDKEPEVVRNDMDRNSSQPVAAVNAAPREVAQVQSKGTPARQPAQMEPVAEAPGEEGSENHDSDGFGQRGANTDNTGLFDGVDLDDLAAEDERASVLGREASAKGGTRGRGDENPPKPGLKEKSGAAPTPQAHDAETGRQASAHVHPDAAARRTSTTAPTSTPAPAEPSSSTPLRPPAASAADNSADDAGAARADAAVSAVAALAAQHSLELSARDERVRRLEADLVAREKELAAALARQMQQRSEYSERLDALDERASRAEAEARKMQLSAAAADEDLLEKEKQLESMRQRNRLMTSERETLQRELDAERDQRAAVVAETAALKQQLEKAAEHEARALSAADLETETAKLAASQYAREIEVLKTRLGDELRKSNEYQVALTRLQHVEEPEERQQLERDSVMLRRLQAEHSAVLERLSAVEGREDALLHRAERAEAEAARLRASMELGRRAEHASEVATAAAAEAARRIKALEASLELQESTGSQLRSQLDMERSRRVTERKEADQRAQELQQRIVELEAAASSGWHARGAHAGPRSAATRTAGTTSSAAPTSSVERRGGAETVEGRAGVSSGSSAAKSTAASSSVVSPRADSRSRAPLAQPASRRDVEAALKRLDHIQSRAQAGMDESRKRLAALEEALAASRQQFGPSRAARPAARS